MPRYFFDLHDGEYFTQDNTGLLCSSLADVSDQAVSVLPDIARDELPDGPARTFWVRVRHEDGRYIFRASLALVSAWIVDDIDGGSPPGQDRLTAALLRAKTLLKTIRQDVAEDGFIEQMLEIDSLFSVAELEVDRLLRRRGKTPEL
jgi:hypothetical protein